MQTLAFNLTWIYLVALVLSTWTTCILFLRANRSAVYPVCATCQFFILLGLLIRLLEWYAPDNILGGFFIMTGLVVNCVTLVLLVQVLYTTMTGLRLTMLVQMLSGAGAFLLVVTALSQLPRVRSAYQQQAADPWFRLYLLLPLLLLFVSGPLLGWLMKRRSLNLTNLSFERVMTVLPDEIFVLDQDGVLVDHNSRDPIRSVCQDREALSQAFRTHCRESCRELLRALMMPGQRVGGELEWQENSGALSVWSWRFQAVRDQRGHRVGAILLLTDLTTARRTAQLLEQQNSELRTINQQLSDYSDLVERYAEAATEQEVASVIDLSIRQRLEQASRNLAAGMHADKAGQRRLAADVLRDCRQALQDIRALVGRLTR